MTDNKDIKEPGTGGFWHNARWIILALLGVLILGLALFVLTGNNDEPVDPTVPPVANEIEEPNDEPALVNTVQIAFLDTERISGGPERGCDLVVTVERQITSTAAPLNAALRELFNIEATEVNGWYNFIANTNDTLSFDRAEIENGVAHIFLTGELSGVVGVCDIPRAAIQIEETALQFPTVNQVIIYLNGEPEQLTPAEM